MSVDEARRHRLYEAIRQTIGEDEAATLMEYLPPVGWADVATRADLERFEAVTRAEFERLEGRLDARTDALRADLSAELHKELRAQTTRIVMWMIPTWISSVGLALAVKLA